MTEPSSTNAPEEQAFRKRMQGVETLLQEVERYADPAARANTRTIVQALLDLHGAGLERILERTAQEGATGFALIDALAEDELVGSLLLLHGLHPLDIDTRVRQALDKVRPTLHSHGANVDLLGIADGIVRLRLEGGDSCSSSGLTLTSSIEEAIYAKAPDVLAIKVDGATAQPGMRIALPLLHG